MSDIVRFKGGLGNQMFQYSLLEALRSRGRDVVGSLGFYDKHPNLMPFSLDSAYKNVFFKRADEEEFERVDRAWKSIKEDEKKLESFKQDVQNRFFWVDEENGYNPEIFNTKQCAFVGYWQSEGYFKSIENRIRNCFVFKDISSPAVLELSKAMKDCVSVHVRRCDYLQELYADICTEDYYYRAMNMMRERYPGIRFAFFSDDINWVKNNFVSKDYIYINGKEIENYHDWYDMYLMTKCQGNIIANSTFSWWGAWLNNNSKRTVIAPSRWLNGKDMPDIWCDGWLRV